MACRGGCSMPWSVSKDQGAGGGFDDIVGDGLQLVDLQHPLDLGEQSLDHAEVAAGQPLDRGDGLRIREVLRIQAFAQAFPVPVQHEQQLVFAQGTVAMREPQPAEQLGVVSEALVDAGHADEHDRHIVTIMDVAQHLQGGGRQSFCLVDDDQLRGPGSPRVYFADLSGVDEVLVNADVEAFSVELDVLDQRAVLRLDLRGVEHGAGPVGRRVDGRV